MANISRTSGKSALTNLLLVVLIALSIVQIFFLTGNSLSLPFGKIEQMGQEGTDAKSESSNDVLGIKKAILEIEYDKVGGKENYDIVTAVQRKSMTDPSNPQNIDAYKAYLNDETTETTDTTTAQTAETIKTDKEAVQKAIDGATFEGNADADILVIEYSDTECPFCIKQYNTNKIQEKLFETYPDQIAFAFKNNRGVNHTGTEVKALGLLCAKKLGGDEAYIKMYHAIMGWSANSVYEIARLPDLATEIGLDATAWQSCVDSKEMLSQFEAETAEAQSFGLNGTPGTLIINQKTGEYDTVIGAYPFEAFQAKVEALQE